MPSHPRITQGAHIKRNTHGSSNEISFSVLDAAKNAADDESPLDRQDPFWAQANEEVSRRKKARRQRHLRMTALMVAVGCALVALAAWAIHAGLEASHQRASELEQVVESLEQVDQVVLPFDELAVAAMTQSLEALDESGFTASYEALRPQVAQAQASIDEARSATEALQGGLKGARDLEASNQLLVTFSARSNMLAAGTEALDATNVLAGGWAQAHAAWEGMLAADTAARDAASLASLAGEGNMDASLAKTEEAIAGFSAAREQLEQAQAAVPEVDLAPYAAYVDARMAALEAARSSAQAFLDDDVEGALADNSRYNALDSDAANMMRSIEHPPATLIEARFAEQRQGLFQTYIQDRQRAADADSFLNDYVSALGR